MKMHAVIFKQGLAVRVVFCYICLFRNPVITTLKVVAKIVCKRKSYPYGGMGAIFSNFFRKIEI